jgi:hypothetical protein
MDLPLASESAADPLPPLSTKSQKIGVGADAHRKAPDMLRNVRSHYLLGKRMHIDREEYEAGAFGIWGLDDLPLHDWRTRRQVLRLRIREAIRKLFG